MEQEPKHHISSLDTESNTLYFNNLPFELLDPDNMVFSFQLYLTCWGYFSMLPEEMVAVLRIASTNPRASRDTFFASKGLTVALNWLHPYGFPFGIGTWAVGMCAAAASNGHIDTVKWLKKNGCPWGDGTSTGAATFGDLELLRWCLDNECPRDKGTCDAAAKRGQLEVLQLSVEMGCLLGPNTCTHAAKNGNLEVVKWVAPRVDKDMYEDLCEVAAFNGHLEVLKWAREQGCVWGHTMLAAATEGHVHILQWAFENGCETAPSWFNRVKVNNEVRAWVNGIHAQWMNATKP